MLSLGVVAAAVLDGALLLLRAAAAVAREALHPPGAARLAGYRAKNLNPTQQGPLLQLLQSLSLTPSSDTVVASAAALLLLHLALHDYNFANSITERDTGAAALAAVSLRRVSRSGERPRCGGLAPSL